MRIRGGPQPAEHEIAVPPGTNGDTLGICLDEDAKSPNVWTFDIDVEVADGRFRVGRIDSEPPVESGVAARAIGTAWWPGARKWFVQAFGPLRDPNTQQPASAELHLSVGPPGLGSAAAGAQSVQVGPNLAGGAWQPTNLGDRVELWSGGDSSDIVSVAGNVSAWKDRSGKNHHLLAQAGARPTTVATIGPQQRTAVAFDGAAQFLSAVLPSEMSFERDQPMWLAIAVDIIAGGAASQYIASKYSAAGTVGWALEYLLAGTLLRPTWQSGAGILLDSFDPAGSGVSVAGSMRAVILQYGGSSAGPDMTMRCDSVDLPLTVVTDTLAATTLAPTIEFCLGARGPRSGPGVFAKMIVGEVCLGTGILSVGERQRFGRYLQERWAAGS